MHNALTVDCNARIAGTALQTIFPVAVPAAAEGAMMALYWENGTGIFTHPLRSSQNETAFTLHVAADPSFQRTH